MCFALNVIRSIAILYLLSFKSCHAFDGAFSTNVPVQSESEGSLLPKYDTVKGIYEKIRDSSDNSINYDDLVFGANGDSGKSYENYKSLYDYSRKDGNVCLLDNLKKNLLWWSHYNGSLVANGGYYIVFLIIFC